MIFILGIVLVDPEMSLDATLIPSPSPRPKNPVFDDEKKSKVSCSILGSDCVTANNSIAITDADYQYIFLFK